MTVDSGPLLWSRPEDLPPPPESPEWLGPEDNPFGIRVLDIRCLSWEVMSTTADPRIADHFASAGRSSGRELIGKAVANSVPIQCSLAYPLVPDFRSGPVFVAPVMEDKWDVVVDGLSIRVARSWTGAVTYVGRIRPHASSGRVMIIDQVEASAAPDLDEEQTICDFDFVIKAYVLGWVVPNRLPSAVRSYDAEQLAVLSFSTHGRRATFATFDDTLPLNAPAR